MPKKWMLLLCFSVWSTVMAQSSSRTNNATTDAIRKEVNRLKSELPALKLPAAEQESLISLLNRSERAAQADHIFLSLHILQYAAPLFAAYAFTSAQAAHGKVERPAFEQEWRRLGPAIATRQRQLATPQKLPLAVQAVVERALTQVQPNYQSSLLYGQEAGIESGLFYLGLAQGQLDFVAFCRTLKFVSPAISPLPAPAAELAATETEVLAAYRQFDTPEQHSTFIRVNSALKVAQDLAQERRTSGVWFQVLEAHRALVAILVKEADNQSATDLRQQSETVRAQLAKSAADQSLGWLYWQMAEAALATDDLKQANAILHHVLPRYFQAQTRNKR